MSLFYTSPGLLPLEEDQKEGSTVCQGHCPLLHTIWRLHNDTIPDQDRLQATVAIEGGDQSAAPDRWQLNCLEHRLPKDRKTNITFNNDADMGPMLET